MTQFIEAGPYVLISASEQDAEELLKLNGFLFAGVRLEITEHVDDGEVIPNKALDSDQTRSVRAQLRLALQQRWDKEQKLLRLNALHTDAVLTQLGAFTSAEIARKTFKSLMVLCEHQFQTQRERDESVTSITLADNSIASVGEVGSLAGTFPRLKNLDLRSNQIATMAGLEAWQGKLNELENIYLGGNPLETADPSYMVTLLEWFPRLQHVDDVLVQTPEQIAQRNLPRAIPQNGPLFRDVDGIGQNFLLDFFPLFDNDRYLLATRYYDEGSHFSLAVDTHSARGPNAPAPLPWTSYIKTSRNFVKIKTQHARVQRLLTGAGAIYDCWKAMPQTRHPCIKKEFVRYIADCHPLSGVVDPTKQNPLGCDGLIISIHGEFEEYDAQADKLGKRSFSRTFVLSRGLKDTTPVRVVSDMLSLRAFSPLPNVYAAPDEHETRPVEGLAVDGQRRQAMVAELSKRTGLNAGYSEMCLHQVEWDFEKALVRFEESKVRKKKTCELSYHGMLTSLNRHEFLLKHGSRRP